MKKLCNCLDFGNRSSLCARGTKNGIPQVFRLLELSIRSRIQFLSLIGFNFHKVLISKYVLQLQGSNLVLKKIGRLDAGDYICKASNGVGHGSVRETVKVEVLRKYLILYYCCLKRHKPSKVTKDKIICKVSS